MIPLAVVAVAIALIVIFLQREPDSISPLHYGNLTLAILLLGMMLVKVSLAFVCTVSWLSLILSVVEVVRADSSSLQWAGWSLVAVNTFLALHSTFQFVASTRTDQGVSGAPVGSPSSTSSPSSSKLPSPFSWQPPVLLPRSQVIDVPTHRRTQSRLPSWDILQKSMMGYSSPLSRSPKTDASMYPAIRYPPPALSSNSSNSLQPLPVAQMKDAVKSIFGEEDMARIARIWAGVFYPGMKHMETFLLREFRTPELYIDALNRVYHELPVEYQDLLRRLITSDLVNWNKMWTAAKKAIGVAVRLKLRWVSADEFDDYRNLSQQIAANYDALPLWYEIQASFLRQADRP